MEPLPVTRHIPMRRELKAAVRSASSAIFTSVTRRIPMRRELKANHSFQSSMLFMGVTRRIPMRRELKVLYWNYITIASF